MVRPLHIHATHLIRIPRKRLNEWINELMLSSLLDRNLQLPISPPGVNPDDLHFDVPPLFDAGTDGQE